MENENRMDRPRRNLLLDFNDISLLHFFTSTIWNKKKTFSLKVYHDSYEKTKKQINGEIKSLAIVTTADLHQELESRFEEQKNQQGIATKIAMGKRYKLNQKGKKERIFKVSKFKNAKSKKETTKGGNK